MPYGPEPLVGDVPAYLLPSAQLPAVQKTPYLVLNDGNKMPMLGLGTWNAQGQELKDAVKTAIYSGYRHIDTATNYKNERLVGEAIAECINEGVVGRNELFVTTKVWNNSHSRGAVMKALNASLRALQLQYVDLFLIHWPTGYQEGGDLSPTDANGQVIISDVDYLDTWRGMEDARYEGLTRSIGVSNFNHKQVDRILRHCDIVPAVNQIECHPYLSQTRLIQYCRSKGIAITAYSPLGSPGRANPKLNDPIIIDDPVVRDIAKRHNRHPAHVLIRYQLQRSVVVIPKAITPAHVKSNLEALDFELSMDDMMRLNGLNKNLRFMKFERCLTHQHYPFNIDY
ncbi:Aldo-keto reductase family 1 member B1, partial [Fragariocoptes setiger]